MKVAFQGERGAYSEVALRNYFNQDVEAIGFELSEEVTDALLNKAVAMAILPVENSIVGNVNVNLDLIYKHPLFAIGEVYQSIHHHLMVVPGTNLSDIKNVYSHPIALAQCRDFINKHGMKAMADYDTAGSCKLLKEREAQKPLRTEAAIGSYLCAETYGLEIISDDIQHTQNNITRFLVLVRDDEIPEGITQTKTSIAFSANHRPGALLDCLQIFKRYDINMTKLESRPIPEDPFQYIFYVDFMSGLKEANTVACLSELNRDAHHVKILGSYSKGLHY